MQIETHETGEVKVVAVSGRLDTVTAPVLEKALLEQVDQGARKLVLNFADLEYVSSAGLRVLLVAAKKLRVNGGELCVAAVNDIVQEIFEISGFGGIMKLFPDERTAVESLG